MRQELIREYFEAERSIWGPDDKEGLWRLDAAWRKLTAEEQAEVRRLASEPCRGYGR